MKMVSKDPVIVLCGLVLLLAFACNLPSTSAPISSTDIPIVFTSVPTSEGPPVPTPTSENAPVSLPDDRTSHAGDYDSSTTASLKRAAGGDRFTFGRYERPFNANTMDQYCSYLDIVDTTAFQDEKWIYGLLVLKGTDESGGLPGNYALELDMNNDGTGDWLILAKSPASINWTTQGVQVWNDANRDVGGIIYVTADEHLSSGNGYEHLVADDGQGENPEAGWVRIDPNSPNTIHFAISYGLLGSDSKYMAGMWAGTGALDPAKFDFNDHMTHAQAGAADPGLELYYPIKALAELDNSCRMAIGFAATGREPGLCPEFQPKPEPGQPPPAGCQRPSYCYGGHYEWHPETCQCWEIPW